ncbi:hypothetical protein MMC27_007358 [Xylographa pallens]|nr:hypothetical protein [Xylographa pallens]
MPSRTSSGILATGDAASVPIAMQLSRQTLRLSSRVTIYTHGSPQLAADLHAALTTIPAIRIDDRTVASFSHSPPSGLTLHFTDVTSAAEAFLGHKPAWRLRGDLARQLGLELAPQRTVKVDAPFVRTSVPGVFAAGDAASPMQTVSQALHPGCAAGAAAPLQVQAEM